MDGFFSALSVASFLLAVIACLFAAAAVTRAMESQRQARSGSASAKRLDEVETALQELATSVRMMKTRRAARAGERSADELPDPYKEPDRWRAVMNARRNGGTVQ